MKQVILLTKHGKVLLLLAKNPLVRINHIASKLDITERATRRVIADLVDAKLLQQHREGRRVFFNIDESLSSTLLELERSTTPTDNQESTTLISEQDNKRTQTALQLSEALLRLTEEGKSFWEFSVDQLISEAGISRSTFYAYFEDKGALIETLLKHLFQDMWNASGNITTLPTDASKEGLVNAIKEIINVYQPHHHLLVAASEARENHAGIAHIYRQLIDHRRELLANQIRIRYESEGKNQEIDADWFSSFLTWGTEYGLNTFLTKASKAQSERLIISLADIVWNLVYAKEY